MQTVTELLNSDASCCGFDIGAEGGFCFNGGGTITHLRMPKDSVEECRQFRHFPVTVYAEDVHTMPGQGVVSNGSLMQRKGRLEGMALATGRVVKWIQPITWISCFTLKRTKHFPNKGSWKNHLCDIARKLTHEDSINKQTADAVLIWIYGMHMELGRSLTKL